LTKRKQNSRQNDASAHRPLPWPAVLPGLVISFSFCHPALVEGYLGWFMGRVLILGKDVLLLGRCVIVLGVNVLHLGTDVLILGMGV
jgi:hypothetical protein